MSIWRCEVEDRPSIVPRAIARSWILSDAYGSLAAPNVPVSGILITIAADAAYRVHALGVRVVAAALRPSRPVLGAPWILPKPLGGDRRGGGRQRGDGHCRHDHGHVDSHVPPRVFGVFGQPYRRG